MSKSTNNPKLPWLCEVPTMMHPLGKKTPKLKVFFFSNFRSATITNASFYMTHLVGNQTPKLKVIFFQTLKAQPKQVLTSIEPPIPRKFVRDATYRPNVIASSSIWVNSGITHAKETVKQQLVAFSSILVLFSSLPTCILSADLSCNQQVFGIWFTFICSWSICHVWLLRSRLSDDWN